VVAVSGKLTTHDIPVGFNVVHVAMQGEDLCVWAMGDPKKPEHDCDFIVIGTGQPTIQRANEHIGSVVNGRCVWHVFARGIGR
jgi:hypothetical protein